MRKVHALLATLAISAGLLAFAPQAAQAVACSTAPQPFISIDTSTSPQGCDITITASVLNSATLTFTVIHPNLGTFVRGTDSAGSGDNAIQGSFTASGGTATLTVSCGAPPASFLAGGSAFRFKQDATVMSTGNVTKLDAAHGCPGTVTSDPPRTTTGTATFSDGIGIVVGVAQSSGSFSQTLTYTLSVV